MINTKRKKYNFLFCLLFIMSISLPPVKLFSAVETVQEFNIRGGLPNFFQKITTRDEIRIAYFGGSITQQPGWRPNTMRWFREQYPDLTFTEINAAIGGTNSTLGVFRLQQDVLCHKPDLIFVEFAVNDSKTPTEIIQKSVEGIVRQAWRVDPSIDICFVYTLKENMLDDLFQGRYPRPAAAMENIAGHYQLPSIHPGVSVANLVKQGKVIFKGKKADIGATDKIIFSGDGVHPFPETGHKLYTEIIVKCLQQMRWLKKQVQHQLPEPFIRGNYEYAKLVPVNGSMLHGRWIDVTDSMSKVIKTLARYPEPRPKIWRSKSEDACIRFRFKGSFLGLYDVVGPDCGHLAVQINYEPSQKIERFDKYCKGFRSHSVIINDDMYGCYYDVCIKTDPAAIDKAAILAKRNNKMDDPARFAGRAIYARALMMIGDIVTEKEEPAPAFPYNPPICPAWAFESWVWEDVKNAITGHGDKSYAGIHTIVIYPYRHTDFNWYMPVGSGTGYKNVDIQVDETAGKVVINSPVKKSFILRVKCFEKPETVTGADNWSYNADGDYLIARADDKHIDLNIRPLIAYSNFEQ